MVCCCVPFCTSEYKDKRSSTISFHEFPVSDVREEWIRIIARRAEDGSLWQPNARSKVCSIHFKKEDFKENMAVRRLLKPTAVPSIFPGYPWYDASQNSTAAGAPTALQPFVKRRGRPVKKKLAEPVSSDEDEDMITPDIKRPKTASLTAQARPVEVSALNKATQARAFTDRAASTPNINSPPSQPRVLPSPALYLAPKAFVVQKNGMPSVVPTAGGSPVSYRVNASEATSEATTSSNGATADKRAQVVVLSKSPIGPKSKMRGKRRSIGQQTTMSAISLAGIFTEIVNLRKRCAESRDRLGVLSMENSSLKKKCSELEANVDSLSKENESLKKKLSIQEMQNMELTIDEEDEEDLDDLEDEEFGEEDDEEDYVEEEVGEGTEFVEEVYEVEEVIEPQGEEEVQDGTVETVEEVDAQEGADKEAETN